MKNILEKEELGTSVPGSITFNGELPSLEHLVHLLAAEAMKRALGNTATVAEMLGISQRVLSQYLKTKR